MLVRLPVRVPQDKYQQIVNGVGVIFSFHKVIVADDLLGGQKRNLLKDMKWGQMIIIMCASLGGLVLCSQLGIMK